MMCINKTSSRILLKKESAHRYLNNCAVARCGVLLVVTVMLLGGCAGLQRRDPLDVMMAGVEPLQGEGLELRMLVKLRIQNPNDTPLEYNGVSVRLDVQGRRFASGVSDINGKLPRFGEAIIDVPVSISILRIARQAYGVITKENKGKLAYEMFGKLSGPALKDARFKSSGEFQLPDELFEKISAQPIQ